VSSIVVRIGMSIIAAVLAVASPSRLDARDFQLLALDDANTLVGFDSARPGDATVTNLHGVRGTLIGIDVRPANRLVYGISSANDVYTIDPTTGVARVISTLTVPFDAGPRSGIDFNPQTDRLRLVGGNGQNLRVHVDLGAAAVDDRHLMLPRQLDDRSRALLPQFFVLESPPADLYNDFQFSPSCSVHPYITFMFCTACPAAPLIRLSRHETRISFLPSGPSANPISQ